MLYCLADMRHAHAVVTAILSVTANHSDHHSLEGHGHDLIHQSHRVGTVQLEPQAVADGATVLAPCHASAPSFQ